MTTPTQTPTSTPIQPNTPEDWKYSGAPIITSQYGMYSWKNMKYRVCQKFGLSDSEEYNIDAISH